MKMMMEKQHMWFTNTTVIRSDFRREMFRE